MGFTGCCCELYVRKRAFLMANNVEITILYDFYGDVLTEKQRDFLNYYYNDDLSLSEIAQNEGITRQGVRDAIKRAETQLFLFEEKLGLKRRFDELKSGLDEISRMTEIINEVNMKTILSREINDATTRIGVIVKMISE